MFDFTEIQLIRAWAAVTIGKVRAREHDERGELIEKVIIAAIFAAGAIAIATLIINKFRSKASSIPTE
ncbi:hypothetical protein ACFVBP_21630 [Nocardioides sp. NPDC057764]|uniref:hypothetical protein n=1 Tax=Nocardioides sp. NPDC057764 TaxID=3346243 RepID=UPI00366F0F91